MNAEAGDAQRSPSSADALAVLEERFRLGIQSKRVVERFDYLAADLYLTSRALKQAPDQSSEVRSTAKRRQLASGEATAREEQDPHFGSPALSVLTGGDYGQFKLAQGSYPRIGDPPAMRAPQAFVVQLACLVGPRDEGWQINALLANLLDDLRSALRGLLVQFKLQRLGPRGGSVTDGTPGFARRLAPERMPPEVAQLLFERVNRVEIALANSTGAAPSTVATLGEPGYLIGLCSTCALQDAGLVREHEQWLDWKRGTERYAVLTQHCRALLQRATRVVVVDESAPGCAQIHQSRAGELQAIPFADVTTETADFYVLRTRVVESVLDAITVSQRLP